MSHKHSLEACYAKFYTNERWGNGKTRLEADYSKPMKLYTQGTDKINNQSDLK